MAGGSALIRLFHAMVLTRDTTVTTALAPDWGKQGEPVVGTIRIVRLDHELAGLSAVTDDPGLHGDGDAVTGVVVDHRGVGAHPGARGDGDRSVPADDVAAVEPVEVGPVVEDERGRLQLEGEGADPDAGGLVQKQPLSTFK